MELLILVYILIQVSGLLFTMPILFDIGEKGLTIGNLILAIVFLPLTIIILLTILISMGIDKVYKKYISKWWNKKIL